MYDSLVIANFIELFPVVMELILISIIPSRYYLNKLDIDFLNATK